MNQNKKNQNQKINKKNQSLDQARKLLQPDLSPKATLWKTW